MGTENEKPYQASEGCNVEWNWLKGRVIANISNDLQNLIIEFEDGLTFKIQALNYKDQAFLAFNPYRDPDTKGT